MESIQSYFGLFFTVLLLSSFAKIFTSLTILRYGIGLQNSGFGLVVLSLSLALSFLVINPQLERLGGMGKLLTGEMRLSSNELESNFRPFLEKHTDAALLSKLRSITEAQAAQESTVQRKPFSLLVSAFLLSELKEAFQIGFLILIPFLVIDLLSANILALLSINSISQAVVALPFKILLFFAVDGWNLLSQKLLSSYA